MNKSNPDTARSEMFNWHELSKDMVWFGEFEYPILAVRLNELDGVWERCLCKMIGNKSNEAVA